LAISGDTLKHKQPHPSPPLLPQGREPIPASTGSWLICKRDSSPDLSPIERVGVWLSGGEAFDALYVFAKRVVSFFEVIVGLQVEPEAFASAEGRG
jgi:hypothetical protein